MPYDYLDSPLGIVEIAFEKDHIVGIEFVDKKKEASPTPLSRKAVKELKEYFEGKRKIFSLPLHLEGTEFQKRVWEALQEIPYGQTCSYKDIAVKIGNPGASRAVGLANNRNPISIVIPCHRVIGANKKLVGYGGGLERKEWLLNMEKKGAEEEEKML